MVSMTCPWCETEMSMEVLDLRGPEQSCAECRTCWLSVDGFGDEDLAMAA